MKGSELNSRRHILAREGKMASKLDSSNARHSELRMMLTRASVYLESQAKARNRAAAPVHSCEELGQARKELKALLAGRRSREEVEPQGPPAVVVDEEEELREVELGGGEEKPKGKVVRHYHREKGSKLELWYQRDGIPFPTKHSFEELWAEDRASIRVLVAGLSARARNTILRRRPEVLDLFKNY